ncbi:MAG: hypothetical protein ACK55Z_09560, partial [bacterium]
SLYREFAVPRAKKLLTVTVDPALFRRIDAAASKIGQTRSAFVESRLRGGSGTRGQDSACPSAEQSAIRRH